MGHISEAWTNLAPPGAEGVDCAMKTSSRCDVVRNPT
jgi:hypothetical protein